MNQMLGEIKLIPYDDVPKGWVPCQGQSLHISQHPKLYMMIGTKFGTDGECTFKLPDLTEFAPKDVMYCIALEGAIPNIQK